MAQQWTLKGHIVVDHLLPELAEVFGSREGLSGIQVKIAARSKVLSGWGWWNSWGTVVTDADGSFRVSESHNDDRRQFKVEVLFDSERLRLKEGQETSIGLDNHGFPIHVEVDLTDKDWFEVHNDDKYGAEDGRQAGLIDLGSIAVTGSVAHRLADMWSLYGRVINMLESYGPAYAFAKRVVAKYPMGIGANNPASASYSNPVNHSLYIKEGEFTTRTLVHELMHQWDYDHSTGEDAMAWQLLKHGSTHAPRESTTFVPFREAFADWVAYRLLKEITDGKLSNFKEDQAWKYPELPLSRSYLSAAFDRDSDCSLANIDFTERGWHSLFNILTVYGLERCDFNRTITTSDTQFCFFNLFATESCPAVQTHYSLKEVLSVWLKSPVKGIDDFMSNADLSLGRFLARAGAILPGLESDKIRVVKRCLDPNGTDNACDALAALSEDVSIRP